MRAFSPRLPRFVMTHVWWNLCHCHLFRCFVPTVPHAFNKRLADCFDEQNVAQYQKRCLEHAITAALIFTSVRDLNSDTCILDLDMATCAWKTAEILLLSDESTRRHLGLEHADVLRHASVCLAFAQSMVGMYPTIEPLVRHPWIIIWTRRADSNAKVDDLSEAVNRFSRGRPGIASLFVDRTASNQAVSKHSALYRACFIDDSFRLEEVHDSSDARRRQSWTSRMGNTPASMGQKTPGLESQSPRNTGRTPDIYTTLTEAAHGAHEPHDTFPWSGVVPNMWDPAALQGPFEGESHMGAANTALSSPSRDRQRDMSVSGLG